MKHTNPSRPRRDRSVAAHAPYNFVPLPERMVPAREPLPAHNAYQKDTLTGWIDCELETCSPTYVRGMMTRKMFEEQGEKAPDKLTVEEKELRAPFFSGSEAMIEGRPVPAIPGSSLRGMLRMLVEIIGYGRMRWVGKAPTFTFRAVAAGADDPLRDPYQDVLGRFGVNVRAGYLIQKGSTWYVQPAKLPADMGWPERGSYLKVKERSIPQDALPKLIRLNSPSYRPQLHAVSFEADVQTGKNGRYVAITKIGERKAGHKHVGVLVCSGNMVETGKPGQESPRKNHALVLNVDLKARTLRIRKQALEDYRKGLTPFQKEELTNWGGEDGCLKNGAPVFYIAQGDEVIYFGHSPNFRIPARLFGSDRAALPTDFVPEGLRNAPSTDLADAIFGWVEEAETGPITDRALKLPIGRAGRVTVSDADFVRALDGVWLKPNSIKPRTLGTPKPTTFQHYLVQDRRLGHDPDDKRSLAHYGTSPEQTQIRGHKLYWHQGNTPDIEASAKPSSSGRDKMRDHESQATRIIPVKPGVRFRFTIHFENLRSEELGALMWALTLPGEPGKVYRHKIGMGKPLGMGSIAIVSKLHITDRSQRYEQLFSDAAWDEASALTKPDEYVRAFERYLLNEQRIAPQKSRLAEVERIQMLLALLEWHESSTEWLSTTRYMEIERGEGKINEYKERPVLPDPLAILAGQPVSPPVITRPTNPRSPSSRPSGELRRGVVKRFDEGPGLGIITQEDGTEIAVHHSGIVGTGRKSLRSGQRVRYRIGTGLKGPEARDVQVE
ncbi:TIGR03986 family type III CRISPR-associated RAMP protein [Candidatus Amarolinea aalborgensis]|uniref:TIGR03986 family type III CRISPR-associated RAMP protein n=1 Tax=Candidatus Amarolinea aalborgensis TaxID=2249329 RepID=UPI003BF966F5